MRAKRIIVIFWLLIFIPTLFGCEAFVRKFTRKKKSTFSHEEMVLAPEEYKPSLDKEGMYRQYMLFWRTWHDELVESLLSKRSQKKQMDCLNEAMKHLMNMKNMLNDEKQKKMDVYLQQMGELKSAIAEDLYNVNTSYYRNLAERVRRNVLRDFSYNKIKGSLK